LTADSQRAARLLQRAMRGAIDPSSGERPGRGVRIGRRSGKPDLLVVVSHFPPSLGHLAAPVAAALVRIIELDMRPEHLSEHSHLFDLSPRETEIAAALLEGHSIDSLAATLGVSRNTARNHVQALFRKTGTNRQSDLIRVLDRIARQ
jgi:DNA-binding CsgD family transcriptional regulator